MCVLIFINILICIKVINNIITEIRKKRKITEKELADKINMSLTGFRQAMEKDDFKASTLLLISKALDISIGSFFEEDNYKTQYIIGNKNIQSRIDGNNNINISECLKEVVHLKELLKMKDELILMQKSIIEKNKF